MPPAKNQQRNLDDYITVAERIEAFYARYPKGSLQTEVVFDDGSRILMRASALRDSEDPAPGIGHAEEIRGKGPVNQSSAVENCETSAWGRAIAALGFEVKKGVASREEMEQADAERERQVEVPAVETITADGLGKLRDEFDAVLPTDEGPRDEFLGEFRMKMGEMGVAGAKKVGQALAKLTPAQAAELSGWLAEQNGRVEA